jgi:hypothetical protein
MGDSPDRVDPMGIRYYAYAFDSDQTDQALANPRSFVSSDPLADAWGFEPHARVAAVTFEQAVPKRDMLYLDKAWRLLQAITGPSSARASARPAFRMFEGDVTMTNDGWIPWLRALTPAEVKEIATDLAQLADEPAAARLRSARATNDDVEYALQYLGDAREFVAGLVADGRGLVYMIG